MKPVRGAVSKTIVMEDLRSVDMTSKYHQSYEELLIDDNWGPSSPNLEEMKLASLLPVTTWAGIVLVLEYWTSRWVSAKLVLAKIIVRNRDFIVTSGVETNSKLKIEMPCRRIKI